MSQEAFTRKLDLVVSRHEELAQLMSEGVDDSQKFQEMSIEYSELGPIVEAIQDFKGAQDELKGLDELLEDTDTDPLIIHLTL